MDVSMDLDADAVPVDDTCGSTGCSFDNSSIVEVIVLSLVFVIVAVTVMMIVAGYHWEK
jgi:hypothetical protein